MRGLAATVKAHGKMKMIRKAFCIVKKSKIPSERAFLYIAVYGYPIQVSRRSHYLTIYSIKEPRVRT